MLVAGCGIPLYTVDCSPHGERSNVLLVIADDLGVDRVASYGVGRNTPPTPTLDTLAAQGMRFDHVYAYPSCSPSRAAIMTGRHGTRTGIGRTVRVFDDDHDLLMDELTLAEVARCSVSEPYATSLAGKWHLGSARLPGGVRHAERQGFEWAAGTLANLKHFLNPDGERGDYWHWEKVTNGEVAVKRRYATTDTTDDAIDRLAVMPEPWFLVVSYNAPHHPADVHPASLHGYLLDETSPDDVKINASIEALDTELGRVLAAIPGDVRARTNVLFVGDNGTDGAVISAPYSEQRSKLSLYEGGVRVPLIIEGPAVAEPGSSNDSLVELVDLWPTVVEWFGLDPQEVAGQDGGPNEPRAIDGRSLGPLLADPGADLGETYVYSATFGHNGFGPYTTEHAMIRDRAWKLITHHDEPDELFHFEAGQHDDGRDLLGPGVVTVEAQQARDRLAVALAELEAEHRSGD